MDTDKYLLKDGIVYEKVPEKDADGCRGCAFRHTECFDISCDGSIYKKVGKPLKGTPEVGKWYRWVGSDSDELASYVSDSMKTVLDGKPHKCSSVGRPIQCEDPVRFCYSFDDTPGALGGNGWRWADKCFAEVSAPVGVVDKVDKTVAGFEVGHIYKLKVDPKDSDINFIGGMTAWNKGDVHKCLSVSCGSPSTSIVSFEGIPGGASSDGWVYRYTDFIDVTPLEEAPKQDEYENGYKIDLSGLPEYLRKIVSEVVQKHAFELGYAWRGERNCQYTGASYLFFDNGSKNITYSDWLSTYTTDRNRQITTKQFLGLKKDDASGTKLFADFSWLHGAARVVLSAAATKNLFRMGYSGSFGHSPNYLLIDKDKKVVLPRTSVPSGYTEVSVNAVLEGRI